MIIRLFDKWSNRNVSHVISKRGIIAVIAALIGTWLGGVRVAAHVGPVLGAFVFVMCMWVSWDIPRMVEAVESEIVEWRRNAGRRKDA